MWTVTVKTLDSQNHKFENVDPEKSVTEFKELIAERVGVDAARQRLIFCGRVLQDGKKIREYELDGRVVHLVQRQPPGAGGPDRLAENERSRGASPARQRRPTASNGANIRVRATATHDIPLNPVFTAAGAISGQSGSEVRLTVVRGMLRQANRILDRMETRTQQGSGAATAAAAAAIPSGPESGADRQTSAAEPEEMEENVSAGVAPATGGSIDIESLQGRASEALGISAGPIHIEMMSIPVTSEITPPGLAEALSAMFQGDSSVISCVVFMLYWT
jgi:hypothetical protein